MSTLAIDSKLWIKNPLTDSVYFSFGWVAVFLALLLFQNQMGLIVVLVLLFNYVHRHLTMALVYGQKEEFDKRRQVYIYLPIVAIIATGLSLHFEVFPYLPGAVCNMDDVSFGSTEIWFYKNLLQEGGVRQRLDR